MMNKLNIKKLITAVEQDDSIKEQCDLHINNHITNVKKSFEWLKSNLPQLFVDCDIEYIESIINNHDASKFDADEYYFYCESLNKNNRINMRYADLHHHHCNPHHWQYWVLRDRRNKERALDMPYEYIIEMVCDWWSTSWLRNDPYYIFGWCEKYKNRAVLSKKTKSTLDNIFKILKLKLDEMYVNKK